ncbi:MAG: TRAP transporter small permease [Oceanospirillum sp.]|nr:TRAP transporter small permease [Oceanospirillum sp.]
MPLLAAVIAYEVGSRYLFNQPTIWAQDLALFLFAYLVGLGGAYAYQKKTHINVDILYLAVSPKTKRIFDVLTGILAAFFMFVLMMIAYEKFGEALQFNYRKMSNWAPHTHHFWMMLVVSGALITLQITSNMVKDIYYVIAGKALIAEPEEEDTEDGN